MAARSSSGATRRTSQVASGVIGERPAGGSHPSADRTGGATSVGGRPGRLRHPIPVTGRRRAPGLRASCPSPTAGGCGRYPRMRAVARWSGLASRPIPAPRNRPWSSDRSGAELRAPGSAEAGDGRLATQERSARARATPRATGVSSSRTLPGRVVLGATPWSLVEPVTALPVSVAYRSRKWRARSGMSSGRSRRPGAGSGSRRCGSRSSRKRPSRTRVGRSASSAMRRKSSWTNSRPPTAGSSSPGSLGAASAEGRAAGPSPRPGIASAVGLLQEADVPPVGAGERTLLVPEVVRLQQGLGNRGAVDRDEGPRLRWPASCGRGRPAPCPCPIPRRRNAGVVGRRARRQELQRPCIAGERPTRPSSRGAARSRAGVAGSPRGWRGRRERAGPRVSSASLNGLVR